MKARVVIAGSRGVRVPLGMLKSELDSHDPRQCDGWEIIHGGCANSPDEDAAKLAIVLGLKPTAMPADWKRYGNAAGPIRNLEMAVYAAKSPVSLLLAYWDGRSTGTANMIANAAAEGLHVVVRLT